MKGGLGLKIFHKDRNSRNLPEFLLNVRIENIFQYSFKRLVVLIFFLLLASQSYSQQDTSRNTLHPKDKANPTQLDLWDVYRIILRKAPRVEKWAQDKKKGKKLKIALASAAGFSVSTKIGAVLSANAAFYTDNTNGTKISSLKASCSYNLSNQIVLPIITNIWTKGNKLNLLGDWRFYRYPEYTYGLGGHTTVSKNANLLRYSNIVIHEAVLTKFIAGTYIGASYNLDWHWGIKEEGQADGTPSDFKKYGLTKTSVSSGIGIVALYDTRLNSINPSDAHYGSLSFCPYERFLGSSTNFQSLILDFRKYITPGESKNVLALWSYNWFTFNNHAPYLDLPSTGWDTYSNLGRGYRQSRFRGKNLLYVEAEYRFGITRNGFLGGVVFTNAQSVTDWPDNRFRSVYPAVGTGLRFKLNKHSNTNLCVDYAFGINGSRGIFFNLGEVF